MSRKRRILGSKSQAKGMFVATPRKKMGQVRAMNSNKDGVITGLRPGFV